MTVQINTTRKLVEVSWDPSGNTAPPEVDVPEFPTHPIIGDPSDPVGEVEHPIFLPPYVGIPEFPTQLPTEPGDNNPIGNLPPNVQPVGDGDTAAVQVFAQGQDGDWHNTAVQPNDGLAALSYPVEFVGESYVEVRGLDGTLVDSGTISVE